MNIGLIGIGSMGRWMAEHLLNAGYRLTVYDINPNNLLDIKSKGAIIAGSVQEVAKSNSMIIMMLPNSNIVELVVSGKEGLFESMESGGVIIDMGSSYVLTTKTLANEAAKNKLSYIDAPVSGGVTGAKKGNLTIMVGGKKEDFHRIMPILKCLGSNIELIGEIGSGHALKAVNNYLSATSLYASIEAMIVLKKLNIDLDTALKVINQSSGQSFSTSFKVPNFVLSQNFNSGFSLDLMLKDIKMFKSIGSDSKTPLLLAGIIEGIYEAASITGGPGQDHTEIIKLIEGLSTS